MDGGPQATFPKTGIGKPALFLSSDPQYSDEELEAKGRDPVTWREKAEGFRRDWQRIFDLREGTEGYYLLVRGTGHLSFSDAPQVMPNTITRFGGDLTDFELATRAILTSVRKFFDVYLKGEGNFDPEDLREETGVIY